MYKPKRIIIKQIGPIKDLTYDFQTGKSLLIQGRNLDNQGQRNNGVGKTFFIDSIAFAITGLTLSGRTMEEFIQDDAEAGYIELQLTHSTKSHDFVIQRYLSRKKPQLIQFSIGGQEMHQAYSDVNLRNDFIVKEIGISKEDLFQFFLISKDRYKSYFKFSDTDKKNVTARFSNADIIDQIHPLLDHNIEADKALEKTINIDIAKLTTQIESYTRFLAELEAQSSNSRKQELKDAYSQRIADNESAIKTNGEFKTSQESKITEYEKEITTLQTQISQQRTLVDDLGEQIDLKEKEVEGVNIQFANSVNDNTAILKQLEVKKDTSLKEVNAKQQTKREIEGLIKQVEAELKTSIECPSCSHEFILDATSTVEELNATLSELHLLHNSAINELETADAAYQTCVQEVKDQHTVLSNLETQKELIKNGIRQEIISLEEQELMVKTSVRDLRNKRDTIQATKDSATRTIESLKEKITNSIQENKMFESKIVEIDALDRVKEIQEYKDLISTSQEKLQVQQESLVTLEEKIANVTQWGLRFKSFKSYLVNQSLKHIQNLMNSFLSQMNTDLSVELEGFKLKGKKVSEKITEVILRGGIPVGSYSKFSGGERGRIDVGSILANQTLINNKAENGLDLILIDEVLESVDEEGIKNIIQSMENIDKTMLLITQNEINTLPNQVITFEKQNGELNIV